MTEAGEVAEDCMFTENFFNQANRKRNLMLFCDFLSTSRGRPRSKKGKTHAVLPPPYALNGKGEQKQPENEVSNPSS